jgi:hypothetical protein
MGDEPITELCKSDRDGEVTSERQFAPCVGTADVSDDKSVAVFDLFDYKWQGLISVHPHGMVRSRPQQLTLHITVRLKKCRVNRHLVFRGGPHKHCSMLKATSNQPYLCALCV